LFVVRTFAKMPDMVTAETTIRELSAMFSSSALAALDDQALAAQVASLLGVWPQLDAARLAGLAAVEARSAYRVDGARDAASWVAWKAGDRRGAARREVELASVVAAMPAVTESLSDGSLTKAKAVELGRASSASPDDQARLVAAAKDLAVEAVAREVDRWWLEQRRSQPELVESVTTTPAHGGGRLEATLDTESLEWVQLAVDSATDQLGLSDLPWASRRAKGLTAVCRYFVEHAPIPTTRTGRPTVVVTVDIETLAARCGGIARLDSGAYISGDAARRLACDAGIIRMITDPASQPLDLGRKTRTVTPAQARAVIHRDRHCRHVGCTAPPWAGEVHHLDFWARDKGRSDLGRLALLCWHHHSLTHRYSATHDLVDRGDGRLHLRQRTATSSDAA
jgi:hypothetical protein